MTYTLIEKEDGTYSLKNESGEIIAEYQDKPSHPEGTIDDVLEDIDSWEDAVRYIITQSWDFDMES